MAKQILHGIWLDDAFDNRRFGRLVTLGPAFRTRTPKNNIAWLVVCECDCGNAKICLTDGLARGSSQSCGCLQKETVSKAITTHGGTNELEYKSWYSMRSRCLNKSVRSYKDYGGRGITICPQWLDDYAQFKKDMGPKPSPEHSIDRIDNDKGYEPGNCRWATRSEQMRNQRPRRKGYTRRR